MITKFKIFENNKENDYLLNNLSEECLFKLGFEKSYAGYYKLSLEKKFKVYDYLIIIDNKIFLNEFNHSIHTINSDRYKTTKIYIDNYLEYYDYIKSNTFQKYVLLCFDDDKFIPKSEYAKKLENKYEKNSDKYIDELNDKSITKYKPNFDKVIKLINILEGTEEDCIKSRKVSDFNL